MLNRLLQASVITVTLSFLAGVHVPKIPQAFQASHNLQNQATGAQRIQVPYQVVWVGLDRQLP